MRTICKIWIAILALTLGVNFECNAQESVEYKKRKTIGSSWSYEERQTAESNLRNAQTLFNSEPEGALDLVHNALLIAIKDNLKEEEAKSYSLLGEFNFRLGAYNLSLQNYQKAIAIYEDLKTVSPRSFKSREEIPTLYHSAGRSAEMSLDYDKSIQYFTQLLDMSSSKREENNRLKAHLGLADVYLKQNKLRLSEAQYALAMEIEEKNENLAGQSYINLQLGKIQEAGNNDDQALYYYEQSQNVAIEIEDDKLVNEGYVNRSSVYKNQNNIEEDINLNQEAIAYNQKRNNLYEVTDNNIGLAENLIKKDAPEKAIVKLVESIKISEELGDIKGKSRAVEVLAKAYEQSGQKEQSIQRNKEHINLEDSIRKIEANKLLEESRKGEILENVQNKISLLEKDKELSEKTIELLRKEKILQEENMKRQRTISYALLFGFLILLATSYLVFRSNKEKNKANQLLALKSLRAQMNPHFIFNALNSVNSFISNSDEKSANRYLSEFSRLMRDVMENSQEDFIPLSKEINILELYLKLEHDRFKDKFDYSFEVDKRINLEENEIPPMLVQPYIENAVWHGLRYKKEKGFLNVKIKKEGEVILIKIQDDGIGRKKSQALKTKNQMTQKSTGLKNIKSRIKIIKEIYKTKLDIQIEDLNKSKQTGTSVTIKLLNA